VRLGLPAIPGVAVVLHTQDETLQFHGSF
jgi:hypothetical protein